MTKSIVGTIYRREGSESRSFKVIECSDCGKQTFERKAKRIEKALDTPCRCHSPRYQDGKRTPTYITWLSMKERCSSPFHKNFNHYGGRGITVCPEWINSFRQFVLDMGERPEGTTIDRIDNNEGYNLDNCRWATPKEQRENQRLGSQVLKAKGYHQTSKGKFVAAICINSKSIYLGTFDNEKDARQAYLDARRLKYS